jgi:hypothetical protein
VMQFYPDGAKQAGGVGYTTFHGTLLKGGWIPLFTLRYYLNVIWTLFGKSQHSSIDNSQASMVCVTDLIPRSAVRCGNPIRA